MWMYSILVKIINFVKIFQLTNKHRESWKKFSADINILSSVLFFIAFNEKGGTNF